MSAARKPKARTLPLGDALQPTIDRLKEIAAHAGNRLLLADGPVHSDHVLLDLCGDALHLFRRAQAASDARERVGPPQYGPWSDGDRAASAALRDQEYTLKREAVRLLRRAKKMRATTPAGVYAKALIVRASYTGAAELAMTLADDLIACKELRQSLWPATSEGRIEGRVKA